MTLLLLYLLQIIYCSRHVLLTDKITILNAAIECPPLSNFLNGQIIYSPDSTPNFSIGTEATYACGMGYTLEGNATRVCVDGDQRDRIGVWSGEPSFCQRKCL